MKKSFLLFLFFAITFQLTAQDGYIVKLDLSLSNNCCKACNEFSVKSIVIKNKNTGETYWSDYFAYRSGFSSSMWISCSVGDVINVSGSGIKNEGYSFDVSVVKGETKSGSYKSEDKGIFWHNSTVSVSTFGYAVPRITSFSGNSNNCVSNEYSSIYTFNLETSNTVIQSALEGQYYSLLIEVANNRNFTNSRTFYINDKSTSYTCSYRTIASTYASDWYGDDLYFRTKIHFSNPAEIYTSSYIFGPRRFYSQVPSIVGITEERTACEGDVITMNLGSQGISLVNNYEFRAVKKAYLDKGIDNVIKLKKGTISGYNIDLTVDDTSVYKFENASEEYVFQVINTQHTTCATTRNETIIEKPSYLSITATPVVKATFNGISYHVTEYGEDNGEITLQVTGGSGSRIDKFVYWNNSKWETIPSTQLTYVNSTTRRFTGLVANRNYYIRVYDTDGCVKGGYTTVSALRQPADVTLNQPTASTVTCHVNNSGTGSKSDGTIRATFSGGIGNYTARLYNNSGSLLQTISSISSYDCQFSPRGVGRYRVRVTDRYGVYKDKYIDVTSNPEVILSATPTDLTCHENSSGSVQLSVSNKRTTYATYELTGESSKYTSENSTSFSSLSAGTYTAMVTNTDGCRDVVNNISVGQPNDIVISPTGSKIARFNDSTGIIDFEIYGGTPNYNYAVKKDSVTFSNGNTPYSASINNLKAGTYAIMVSDINGCKPQADAYVQVRQPDAPLELSFSQQPQNVDCYSNATGEVYPTATGGWGHYQYGFNGTVHGTSNTIGGLNATGAIADTVFVVDSAGVIEKLPVTITEPTQLVSSVENIYNLKCFEDNSGAVKLNISGGTKEYRIKTDNTNWVDGDSLSSLPIMDNEPVYVLDANDCPSQVDVTITQPDKIAIVLDTVIDAFCGQNNGGISALISGGTEAYTYNWTYQDSLNFIPVNSNSIAEIYSGQYKLLLTDAHGCSDSLKASVSDTDGPKILAYTIDSISCFGGSDGKLTIQQVSGGMPEYTYIYNGIEGDSAFEGLNSGTYYFRLLDKKGCKQDKYYTIPEPEDITISGTIINPTCHNSYDGFIVPKINGGNSGYAYNWSNNSIVKDLRNLNSGMYTLTVTDRKACSKSESFEIKPPHAPSAHLDQNVGVLCTGNSLELDGGDFISYQWYKNTVLVSEDRYLTVDQTGQYTLKISNELGCVGVDTFDLEVSDTPLDAIILLQDSAMVDEVVEAIDVTWPVPDSVQWHFDYPVDLSDNNNWSQQFSTSNTGAINVTLRAWYGGCFSDSSKTVTIFYEEGGIPLKSAMNEPLILGYKAYPNPNDGDFHVGVELSRHADISLHLFSVGSANAIDVTRQYGLESYDVPFNLTELKPGVYIIVLIAEHEQQRLKIVIN